MTDRKLTAIRYVWVATSFMMMLLFASMIASGQPLGVGHVVFGVVLGGAAFVSTAVITETDDKAAYAESEKAKRDTLDRVLRDLSDEQLHRLQQRLRDGTIDDDMLSERIVGADGELVDWQPTTRQ